MAREIITIIPERKNLLSLLNENPGIIFIKFGAEWCGPCKKIEQYIHDKFNSFEDHIQTAIIDIDENLDVYAFLKSKKIVTTIPSIVCYLKGSNSYVPDDVICDSNVSNIEEFFNNCFESYNNM